VGVGVARGVAVAVGLAVVALCVGEVVGEAVAADVPEGGFALGVPVGVALEVGAGVVDVPKGGCALALGLMEVETKAGTVGDGACEMRSPRPQASRADRRATAPAPVKK
jgi:hypothetical protein